MQHEERATGGDSSTSFAVDVVRRLGSQLDSFQEKHEYNTTSTLKSEEHESSPSSSAEVLDVTHCTSLHSTKQLQVALQLSGQDDAIELARVTFAAYGCVLDRLLKDAERVNDQAWFWTQVEEDPSRTILYLVQTFPARLVCLASAVARNLSPTSENTRIDSDSIQRAWRLIRDSPVLVIGALFPHTVRKGEEQASQKLLIARARALSPLGLTRHEARHKRKELLTQRDQLATRLGALAQTLSKNKRETPQNTEQLMQEVNQRVADMQTALEVTSSSVNSSGSIATSLDDILSRYVEAQQGRVDTILSYAPTGAGPPSRLARLWPTFVLAPLGTIIVIRVVTSSWDTIVEKAKEARETIKGFAINWVYEPCLKLLDTIKTGDEEGVIMSKESLNSDLQSLERMVTEFSAEKYGLRGAELDAVTQKVREGDLTTVLKIYESELKSPFKSAVTGSLIRALLIQVQKVKVDIAVAMRGVDQLLKSQQLLFGAIGIAPAMAITYYVGGFVKERISRALGQKGKEVGMGTRFRAWEAMRRIDRLLADPMLTSGPLPPLTQGLLLLDLSLLRTLSPLLLSQVSRGRKGTAKRLRMEFIQDVRDLESSGDVSLNESSSSSSPSSSSSSLSHVGLGWHARRAAVDRMWKSWGSVMSLNEI